MEIGDGSGCRKLTEREHFREKSRTLSVVACRSLDNMICGSKGDEERLFS